MSGCVENTVTQPSQGQTYYVDNVTGDDSNAGTIRAKSWASLDKVNSVTFQPGDNILFKAGTVYSGQLKPKGSGNKGAPIIIDMYGVGDKPRIDGKGAYVDTVLLENVEYWEVNDLEITNLGATRENWRTGVKVSANNFGTMHHIVLKNLYVHDVNGSLEKSTEGCGIFTYCSGKKLSRFDGLLIEDRSFTISFVPTFATYETEVVSCKGFFEQEVACCLRYFGVFIFAERKCCYE